MSEIEQKIDEIREMKQKLERLQEAILIYSDAVDAATTQLRQNLGADAIFNAEHARANAETRASPDLKFDPQKIKWIDARDKKDMPYRLATGQNNVGNPDFAAAKELLRSGGGTFRQKDGLSWLLFPDGDAIGVWDYKRR